MKRPETDNTPVRRHTAGPTLPIALVLTAGAAVGLMLALGPTASASQLDDLGTNDPTDIEGVDEAPWRAWDATSIARSSLARTDITTGPEGQPSIVWGAGDARLSYPADGTDAQHRFETVTLSEDQARAGGVAIQEDGRVWVTYQAQNVEDGFDEIYVKTATDPDGEWTRYRLAEKGWNPRIGLDDTGVLHVVYEGDNRVLHHATFSESEGWLDETITTVDPSGARDLRIAVDHGRLHVVWGERIFQNPEVREGYAVQPLDTPNAEWTIDTIPKTPVSCRQAPDVGAAPDGSAWISCRSDGGITAWHRTTDGTWSQEQVSDGSNIVPPRTQAGLDRHTTIAVDDEGVPHIAFHTRARLFFENDVTQPGQPHYASRTDGEWTVETIDRDGQDNGRHPSIALDGAGRPQVSYVLANRIDPNPGHPCPGCGELNERFKIHHAQPFATTVLGDLPIVAG